ncbi:hypothetical protein VSS37_05860 [Candidatus Thiothrix sp. Deng01]|uniref:Phage tail assembly protein n=1 Tax=Candidatus Thiothrix phosphatis TaxID=3112415 RepID=A0ABU6CWP2_9GAMM|nr:hypothetical protein [Candidatus Thiothrix sp. Deng01]MEB4590497.1 hypothetical protein [Candidatus Thiothrix sp. Deng01]
MSDIKSKLLSPKLTPVTVKGEPLFLRQLSADEYMQFVESQRSEDGTQGFMAAGATMVALSLCDADGKRIFSTDEASQITSMMPLSTLRLLADAAIDANGLGSKEDTAKNS